MRAFPVVSAYSSFPEIRPLARIQPYAGLSVGVAQLWNARGFDTDGTVFGLEGETLDFGATGGLYLTPRGGPFMEGAYWVRRFESVTWEFPVAEERLPEGWPRSLETSGWTVSLGWQFRFRDGNTKEAPKAEVGGTTPRV